MPLEGFYPPPCVPVHGSPIPPFPWASCMADPSFAHATPDNALPVAIEL